MWRYLATQTTLRRNAVCPASVNISMVITTWRTSTEFNRLSTRNTSACTTQNQRKLSTRNVCVYLLSHFLCKINYFKIHADFTSLTCCRPFFSNTLQMHTLQTFFQTPCRLTRCRPYFSTPCRRTICRPYFITPCRLYTLQTLFFNTLQTWHPADIIGPKHAADNHAADKHPADNHPADINTLQTKHAADEK